MRTRMRPVAVRFIDREQRWTRRSTNRILWFFEILLVILRPLGITSVIVQVLMVGRSCLDPGTLGVFPHCPRLSFSIQFWWPTEVECAPTFSDVLADLKPWLDNWLDLRFIQGTLSVEWRGAKRQKPREGDSFMRACSESSLSATISIRN